jgi:RNA polymerase sigma-70 factor, ECF subfamily
MQRSGAPEPATNHAELYEELAPYVHRLVHRFFGPDARHHDLVQEVFYRILSSRPKIREPDQLRAWVRAITLNVVYNEFRLHRKRPTTELDEEHLVANLERSAEARDLLSRLTSKLDRLPEQERSAFVLRFVERRTLEEIAVIEGYSRATAQRRLRRPRRILKAFLLQNPSLARTFRRRGQQVAQGASLNQLAS